MTVRPDPAALAAWTAYRLANERARQDYDRRAVRAPQRVTGACDTCDRPVGGVALYCPDCLAERRRAAHRKPRTRKQRKAAP